MGGLGGSPSLPVANFKRGRFALLVCPPVNTWYNSVIPGYKGYESSHRPGNIFVFGGSMKQAGYTATVGFTDGSAQFYSDMRPVPIYKLLKP